MDVILNLTPTGMVPTKAMTPHVPISVQEIVEDVLSCHELGITSVHLHARDVEGRPTHRSDIYASIIEQIRKHAPELVICVSLSGRATQKLSERAAPLGLTGRWKPDMGSLTLSSLNFSGQASINEPDIVKALACDMVYRGIVPELEIFDLGMVNYAKYLIEKVLLHPPYYANIFLGNIAGAQLDLAHAGLLVRDLPPRTFWSFGGIGNVQLDANALAIASGGGVRVGLEDSIYLTKDRTTLATNRQMVERIHQLAALMGRQVMKPMEFRSMMGMATQPGWYGR